MSESVDAGNIEVQVASELTAERLREDFADLTMRVNLDLVGLRFNPADPISIEMAITQAERSVDYHLNSFIGNCELQALRPEIKQKFRSGIQEQALR